MFGTKWQRTKEKVYWQKYEGKKIEKRNMKKYTISEIINT